mmetsp:Transcript_23370/g.55573  ORF Transcript_23370/g.55573 Transcript_23370/m.55573 type:complete len:417 (+) Transcript_23370:247-1497(+)
MDDAEALEVATRPFKVVHQAPDHVAGHGHALLQGSGQCGDVAAQIGGAVVVLHAAVADRAVLEGAAVLGHVDRRQAGVVSLQLHEQVGQALGIDLPVHVGHGQVAALGVPVLAAGADDAAGVVVDAEVVHGLGDGREVTRLHHGRVGPELGQHALGVVALEQGLGVPAPAARVGPIGRLDVWRHGRGRHRGREVEHDAELAAGAVGPQCLHGQPVRQQQVVGHLGGDLAALDAGREIALLVAQRRDDPGLVVRGDAVEPVAQPRLHMAGVVDEAVHRVAVVPAAAVLQALRQVPVVERGPGVDAALPEPVNEAFVEVQALRVEGAMAQRLHARPGDGEAVAVDAQRCDQVQVFVQAVEMVAGQVGVAAVGDRTGLPAEAVPDRLALAVGVRGALDLEAAGGHAPGEVARELAVQGR